MYGSDDQEMAQLRLWEDGRCAAVLLSACLSLPPLLPACLLFSLSLFLCLSVSLFVCASPSLCSYGCMSCGEKTTDRHMCVSLSLSFSVSAFMFVFLIVFFFPSLTLSVGHEVMLMVDSIERGFSELLMLFWCSCCWCYC